MARVFVTGSAQGIGAETARQLLDLGHQVVLHARNEERGRAARAANPGAAAVVVGDFEHLDEVRALAAAADAHGPYDVIIHNGGIGGGAPERRVTPDGLERIFQVNVAAPYVLTCLMDLAPRMIYLTSGLEADGDTRLDDLQWDSRPWDGMQAYSDSKLYDSMLAFELADRHPRLVITCVDPGWIKTQLGGPDAWDPVDLGAQTQVWLATSDDPVATTSAQYLKRMEAIEPNPQTQDVELRAGLIRELERLTGHGFR